MDIISTSDLRKKQIINLCNGEVLGYSCDFEFNKCNAQISGLILDKSAGFLGIGKETFIIPWNRIECIGEDTVLVKFTDSELSCLCREGKKKRFFG